MRPKVLVHPLSPSRKCSITTCNWIISGYIYYKSVYSGYFEKWGYCAYHLGEERNNAYRAKDRIPANVVERILCKEKIV